MIRYTDVHTHAPEEGVTTVVSVAAGAVPPAGTALFSAGVHPWDAAGTDLEAALDYLRHAPVAAIGEIGLDYVREVDRDAQRRVLETQLALAMERGLPVVLHCVRAYNDMLKILEGYRLRGVIFHGYVGSTQQIRQITDRGYYVSAGPVSLGSPKTRESLSEVPVGRLFAETDNSGAKIEDVYAELARLRGVSAEGLAEAINDNFIKVFG